MSRWLDPTPVEVSDELREAVGGHPLIAETLVRRGINTVEAARAFLDPDHYRPTSAFDLPDMARGAERAARAVREGERALIWGDFDVDGQTATTLLVSVFDKLGLRVSYYIPDRQREGHGVQPEKLGSLISELSLDLVITCDTGMSAHEAVALANAHGVDVIVTDHHQLPEELPNAYACINPQRLPVDHPMANLPGVGCAYKFVEALMTTLGQPHELLQDELDLVALGIVADLAVQKADTRYLLQRGLAQLRQTSRHGLQAMLYVVGISPEALDETDIAFTLAPRLNSLGRLSDANQAVEFLRTTDRVQAEIIANRLEVLNNERKLLERQVFDSAVKQVEQDPQLLEMPALVLWYPGWSNGVLGIAANRLVELYKRPVILLNVDPDGIARGSARSIEGIDITEAAASCSHLLTNYGGHVMAAGVSLPVENLTAFRRCVGQYVRARTSGQTSSQRFADGSLILAEISLDLVRDLQRLAPFGVGNPALSFVAHLVRVVDQKALGRDEKHLRWVVADKTGETREVTRWRTSLEETPTGPIDLLFSLREDHYKGRRELLIEHIDSDPLEIDNDDTDTFAHQITALDWRTESDKLQKLQQFLSEHDALVWCEGQSLEGIASVSRNALSRSKTLILWSIPPSGIVMRRILNEVQPRKVILVGEASPNEALESVLKRIAGIIRFAVHRYEGSVELTKVGASSAQTLDFVQAALGWFAARGDIVIDAHDGDSEWVTVQPGDAQKDDLKKDAYFTTLQRLHEEVLAYRAYFMRVTPEKILKV